MLSERLRLLVVGDGILMEPAKQLVNEFCCRQEVANQWVYFTGKTDRVNDYMRLMDVFVLPSLAEGISNTILEAMATSLPVIATDVGGNGELVVAQETGYLVPVDDIDLLTEAMKFYCLNPDKLYEQGQAGRKRIEEHFSLQNMVNLYENVYQRVLS